MPDVLPAPEMTAKCSRPQRAAALACLLISCGLADASAQAGAGARANITCLSNLAVRAQSNPNGSFCSEFSYWTNEVLSCAGVVDYPLRPVRLLAPNTVDAYLPAILKQFKSLTGFEVLVDYLDLDKVAPFALDTAASGKQVYDGWYVDPVATVDLSHMGMIEPLDSYISADRQADWADVSRFFRLASSVYNGSAVGFPAGGKVSTFYYRADVLARAGGLPPPATWEDVIAYARVLNGSDFNGDGAGDYALCFQIFDGCLEDYTLFGQLLAPMTQAMGLQSGWLFDPDSLKPLVGNQATERAITILQQLLRYTDPDRSCNLLQMAFLQGRCAMTIKWDEQFKGLQLFDQVTGMPYNPWKGGAIGYAQLPGSAEVLDRATGQLVPCTPARCPYATDVTNPFTGQSRLVNRAPYSGIAGINGMVNAGSSPASKQTLYQLFSFIGSMPISYPLVINLSPVGPFRDRHFATDATSLALWTAAGYNTTDVRTFLANMQVSLANQNIASDMRMLKAVEYRNIIKRVVALVIAGSSTDDAHKALTDGFQAIYQATEPSVFWTTYWSALNLKRTYQPPASPEPFQASSPHGPELHLGAIIGIVVGGSVACVMITLLVVYSLRRAQALRWGIFKHRAAPRCGPASTLLVTDIENSTLLWESVAQEVMDHALTIHHTLVRALLAENGGYESCTEGDSFILAFHDPMDALGFASQLQLELLQQDWPEELLASPLAATMWASKIPSAMHPKAYPAIKGHPSDAPSSMLDATPPTSAHNANTSPPSTPNGKDIHIVIGTTLQDSPKGQDGPDSNGGNNSQPPSLLNLMVDKTPLQHRRLTRQITVSGLSTPNFMDAIRVSKDRMPAKCATQTTMQFMAAQWQVVSGPLNTDKGATKAVLVYRGLRVRVGMHSGIHNIEDAELNPTTNRVTYSGQPLVVAKATADCAAGGQILMSHTSFEQLSHENIKAHGVLLNMGDYTFTKSPEVSIATLLQYVPSSLEARVVFFPMLPRNTEMVQAGVFDAPVGDATISFVNMVGAAALTAWDKELAAEATDAFSRIVQETLLEFPKPAEGTMAQSTSYLVELSSGFALTAFTSPGYALAWATALISRMRAHTWSEELLAHELCEPVVVGVDQSAGARQKSCIVFCGPRLKAGVDTGQVHAAINPVTGRMAYRGRVMNRTARISEKAGSGQVWCSEAAWQAAQKTDMGELKEYSLEATSLGSFNLKGVSEPLSLMHVAVSEARTKDPFPRPSGHSNLSFNAPSSLSGLSTGSSLFDTPFDALQEAGLSERGVVFTHHNPLAAIHEVHTPQSGTPMLDGGSGVLKPALTHHTSESGRATLTPRKSTVTFMTRPEEEETAGDNNSNGSLKAHSEMGRGKVTPWTGPRPKSQNNDEQETGSVSGSFLGPPPRPPSLRMSFVSRGLSGNGACSGCQRDSVGSISTHYRDSNHSNLPAGSRTSSLASAITLPFRSFLRAHLSSESSTTAGAGAPANTSLSKQPSVQISPAPSGKLPAQGSNRRAAGSFTSVTGSFTSLRGALGGGVRGQGTNARRKSLFSTMEVVPGRGSLLAAPASQVGKRSSDFGDEHDDYDVAQDEQRSTFNGLTMK